MKLLTKELIRQFPKLYANGAKNAKDVQVIAKFFCPWAHWTWYATEFDGKDIFFGFVVGDEEELGYFSLSELEGIEHITGLKVEREYSFKATLEEVMDGSKR